MRLISCHVEGFGAIRCTDFAFDKSPAVFNFENGYGKTTLCAFITAMLYGFDTAKSNSQKFEDRVHYYPFDGGRFGGSLTFTEGGRTYRVERFFDKKSQTKDTLNLYIDDKPTACESDDVGQALLGVDRESFLRVVLMDSRDSFLGSTDGINERLGKFSGGEGDLALKDAIARLDGEAKKLKVRGGGGEINRLAAEIAKKRDRIENLNTIEKTLDALYKKREELLERRAELKTAERDFRERSVLKEKRAAYKRLVRECEDTERALNALLAKYPKGMPSAYDITALSDMKSSIERINAAIAETRAGASDVEVKFSGETPPTEEEIALYRGTFAEIGEVENELSTLTDGGQRDNKRRLPLIISGGVLIAAAVAVAFLNLIAGIATGAVGVLLITLSLFIKGGNGEKARAAELNAKKADLTERIESFLSQNGYAVSGVAALDFAALEADVKTYNIIKKEREEREESLSELGRMLYLSTTLHDGLVEKFALTDVDAPNATNRIFADRREYDDLLVRRDKTRAELADYVAAFGRGEDILRAEAGEDETLTDPDAMIAAIEREILNNENDITQSEDLLSEKEGALTELSRLREAEAEAAERLAIITKTQEYLKRADDRMISKYLSPIRERFLEYGAELADYIGESFSMDRDLNLYFEAHGERHTEKHLSQGQHAIVALCMRLAIAEVIFGKDKGFILLDDPFCALDEKHFKSVASLIKKLSKTTQIVYFTCHNSRNI
ncbi:MAG: AAA family ATPase [Clostridia bacterium]|nr:AAA family ATPase [Clostridia bacterium]